MKKATVLLLVLFLLIVPAAYAKAPTGPEFHLKGSQVRLIGAYGDNFNYDGSNVTSGDGFVEIHVNSDTDTGSIVAQFTVPKFHPSADLAYDNPTITVIFPLFGTPTGVMPEYWQSGIADDIDLHGDSGQEAPVLPTIHNAVASWGPALVFVNGEQIRNPDPMMGAPNPMGAFAGHMMYSERVRDAKTEAVYNGDKSGFYSPKDPGNGSVVDPEISLIHLLVRSDTPDENNFPAFNFAFHVNFEQVEETEAKPISGMTFAKLKEIGPEQAMAMIKQMMPGAAPAATAPPATLPVSGGVRSDLFPAPYELVGGGAALALLGLSLGFFWRRRKAGQ